MIGRKAAQERFSEESFRNSTSAHNFYFTGNAFLKSSTASSRTTPQKLTAHNQAWIDSRNLTTITTEWKHRQPIFLHPTLRTGAIRPSRLRQCSSIWIFILSQTLSQTVLVLRRIWVSRRLWVAARTLAACRQQAKRVEGYFLRHNIRAFGPLSLQLLLRLQSRLAESVSSLYTYSFPFH